MRLSVIKIGNSRGIRLPKPVLEELGSADTLEGELVPEGLLIRPVSNPRTGWEQEFAKAVTKPADELSEWEAVSSEWDAAEWTW